MFGSTLVRKVMLSVFSVINPGDVTIRHHWTGGRLRLHSFRHKGYWWHGRRREHAEMEALARIVHKGDDVVEVGAHIGYISQYLSALVGQNGHVIVIEPGENNLRYLRRNLEGCGNVDLLECAAGAAEGQGTLYLESLTGQNNSLVKDYDVLRSNEARALKATVTAQQVRVVPLDNALGDLRPAFVKIDTEGFELEVLRGMTRILRLGNPILMLEVSRFRTEVEGLLRSNGYRFWNSTGTELKSVPGGLVNVFAFSPRSAPQRLENFLRCGGAHN